MSGQTDNVLPIYQEREERKQAAGPSEQHQAEHGGSGPIVETESLQAEQSAKAQGPGIEEKQDSTNEKQGDTREDSEDTEVKEVIIMKHSLVFRVGHILLGIILAIWPYIFAAQVWKLHRQGGLQASDTLATLVLKHPHSVDFFITTIVVVISAMMTYLFTTALMCLYWYSVKLRQTSNDFFVLVYRSVRTGPEEWPLWKMFRLVQGNGLTGWSVIAIMVLFSTIFTFISPGLNALLIPHPFYRIAPLHGYELDFSTSNASCTEWINNNPIPSSCNWIVYNGFQFTDCLNENQLVDVLESGRSSMRNLAGNNNDTVTFIQMGGISFLGPTYGVFPLGPNGIQAFNTLDPLPGNPLRDALPYNYTVDLQGVQSNVNCRYDSSTPIGSGPFDPFVLNFTGSCSTGDNVPEFPPIYFEPHFSNNTLAGWPCKTSDTSYVIYLYGTGNYLDIVGNMTCTVAPLQHALFDVTYSSNGNLFVSQGITGTSSNSSTSLLDNSVSAIPYAISEAQNLVANMVAESAITYAVKYFGRNDSNTYVRDDSYLRLYEALIGGILEYQATYTRMIYSSYSPPLACRRLVAGTMSYEVIGWEAIAITGAYLIPLTIINLSSIIILLISICRNPKGQIAFLGLKPEAGEALNGIKDSAIENARAEIPDFPSPDLSV